MRNLLTLHQAIALALLDKKSRAATFNEIADFIERKELFPNRKANISLAEQVMLRSTKSKGQYFHLFEQLSPDTTKLRNL